MSVELLREQITHQTDANFQVTALVSLLGLVVSLPMLLLLGSDFGTLLAFAG
jgi:hypothetical protein